MKNNENRTARLVYGAILSALAIYGGMGFFLPGMITLAPNSLLPVIIPVLVAAAVVETVLLLAWAPRLLGKSSYLNYCVLRWALAEGVGIYGLVLVFLGAGQGFFLTFLGWSLVLILLCAPTEADQERHELLQKS